MVERTTVKYRIRSSKRARRVRLVVHPSTAVEVVVPHGVSQRRVDRFVQQKRAWIAQKQAFYREHTISVTPPDELPQPFQRYQARAQQFVRDRVVQLAAQHGFSYTAVRVVNTRSQWGSCSRAKRLSFCYKILFLPPELAEYIFVHELAHTEHLNHSRAFWQRVEQVLPDYRERRRELKKYILDF